ncbi:MMPL family transporter [Rhodopseudomonas sp. B29]|uniref:hopanoid transporter HpnN n=1 Tax=Rhodopseudomonas sp. B29 TaxID=95607 RepID=UPI00034A944B|nr:MMPL family transporter [Rhodopseudomonas sp. B29]
MAMLNNAVVSTVDFSVRHRWAVVIGGLIIAVLAAAYAILNFSITTDVEALISQKLPWHQRQIELARAFPQQGITAVITAPSPENADRATALLADKLAQQHELFRSVGRPDSGEFFDRNGLLFQPLPDVKKTAGELSVLKPVVAQLAADPSLRGVMNTLADAAKAAKAGRFKFDDLAWPLSLAKTTLTDVLADKPATFSWLELTQGKRAEIAQRRHFLDIDPVLDFSALQPGRAATDAIHAAAKELKLGDLGATVSLTGQVPMNDDQFSVISDSAWRDTLTAAVGVLVILWLALRSWRIIAAVFFSLMVGLALTAALGMVMVGSFNLISVAFFVLFVGLGVDFGIQFSVRYRAERHDHSGLEQALHSAARKVGTPLALAAAATAAGFFAFIPTDYSGLSELGLIAGTGMVVAFLCSITLVPAMLALLQPPGEAEPVGFKWLAPLDHVLQRHRFVVIGATVVAVLAATPLLAHLTFDFNPINLQNPNSPSVKTYHELQASPQTAAIDADVIAPDVEAADTLAAKLRELPEVSRTTTLSNFIPADQPAKIAALKAAGRSLRSALSPSRQALAPNDQDVVAAIQNASTALTGDAGSATDAAANDPRDVAKLLDRLGQADPAMRQKATDAIVRPLQRELERLRASLDPQTITVKTLPEDLRRSWLMPDGRALVQTLPKGNTDDNTVLRGFAQAILKVAPNASGTAISYYESSRTITWAFIEAGLLAFVAIAALLIIALRRFSDVALTLVPLLIAGAVTLEICAASSFPLNFANIIALPLLLGVGVAFKVYYIMAWRAGKTGLLQSTLTRAVVFSAMTNAVAFGSMWASSYPGMSSMGQLMFLSLVCTMAAAVFFQPVLMGAPRQIKPHEELDRLPEAAE